MPLAAGQALSHYEILAPIGAGGMGEVYRARDTRLGREVAIKVLPEPFATDTERLLRFEREAKSLATLNHPNVAQVYGIDQIGDVYFIAMELVPGEDLGARLARGPLPVQEALDVCRQIAEGLEAAHEAGVVHRDLKPANVRLTPDRKAKVLDFGLAKAVNPEEASDSTTDGVLSTEAGRVLGTPTYMAPEQARGRPTDRRVDVWAFGCVLYECLAAQRAFAGEALSDVLVALLHKEPDWTQVPAETPTHVQTLLERCLEKDPRTRLRDIGEARILLERGPLAPAPSPLVAGRRGGPLFGTTLVVAMLGIGALVARFWIGSPSASARAVVHLERVTEMAGMEETPAVSPDDRTVAFVARVDGKRQVFLRPLAKGTPQQVTSQGDHSFPRWVDESTLIYYRHPEPEQEGTAGALYEIVSPSSSSPRLLGPAQGEADVDRVSRSIAMFRTDAEGPALVITQYGDTRIEARYPLPPGTFTYRSPRWSPDGQHLAFEAFVDLTRSEIRVMDFPGGETHSVASAAQTRGLAWLPDGSGLVYASSEGSTLAYPPIFRLRTVSREGKDDVPVPCDSGGYASYVEPDVTQDGKLVASRVAIESDIYRYPVDGTPRENVANAVRITHQTGVVQVPSASPTPENQEVAYLWDSGGRANVWVATVDGSRPPRPITAEQDPHTVIGLPLWSPSGKWINYYKGPPDVSAEEWLIRPDGTGGHRLVQARGGASWSRDGEWLYYMPPNAEPGREATYKIAVGGGQPVPVRRDAAGMEVASDGNTGFFSPSDQRQGEIFKVAPLETGTPEPLRTDLQSRIPLWPHHYALSPDDLWLATPLRDDGTTNLWLISTSDGALRQITDFQRRATLIGRQVSWSSDSKYLFAALMETDADIVLLDGALP